MRLEELAFVCQEAARDLAAKESRPLPAVVVVPGPQSTRLIRLPDFPEDDHQQRALLQAVASDELLPASAPAYGFIAEAELADGTEVLLVVYGAHRRAPQVTAAPLTGDGRLGAFLDPEPLDPEALAFVQALQHAVDHAQAPPAIPTS